MNENTHHITPDEIAQYSMERLQKELTAIQASLEMLYTMNNSLEGLDITEGGGSPQDQEQYQRLDNAQRAIVAEINKRHMLAEIDQKA
jgi:hypothetical protein